MNSDKAGRKVRPGAALGILSGVRHRGAARDLQTVRRRPEVRRGAVRRGQLARGGPGPAPLRPHPTPGLGLQPPLV